MKKRRRNKPGRITAWLVTWESHGEHAKHKDKIAAILNWRCSPNKALEIIEHIYANEFYSLEEYISFAKNRRNNPYPATFDDINGVPWLGRIFCGHNPFLMGRLVDNLYVKKEASGKEQVTWDERPKPILKV